MYLDDILKYKRVCVASFAKDERIVDKILNDVLLYLNNKPFVINEFDDFDISILNETDVVCFKPINLVIKKGNRIPYNNNFLIFKSHLYKNINSYFNINSIHKQILYESDLVISVDNEIVTILKDRYDYFNKDGKLLYNEILIENRYYKIQKILKRNERFT